MAQKRGVACVLALSALCGCQRLALDITRGISRVQNPKTYHSPSGSWTVRIDPDHLEGRTWATYRLTHDGRVVWEKNLPFTLLDGGITDDGVFGGYAHYSGLRSPDMRKRTADPLAFDFTWEQWWRCVTELQVVIVDSSGTVRLQEKHTRHDSRSLHSPPRPLGVGAFVDGDNDRLVVRVYEDDEMKAESWWAYQLSTALPTQRFQPALLNRENPEVIGHVVDARPIAGTPLTLIHCALYTTEGSGAYFSVVDLEGRPVWTCDLPGDYELGDDFGEGKLWRQIAAGGAIRTGSTPAHFALRCVAAGQWRTYAVSIASDGLWKFEEVSCTPVTQSQDAVAAAPDHPLRLLRSITLDDLRVPRPAVRGVHEFAFDTSGRICFIRPERTAPHHLVCLDPAEGVVADLPLDPIGIEPGTDWSGLAWVGGDRFILTRSDPATLNSPRAWVADLSSRTVVPLESFHCPEIRAISGSADGSFVAVGACSRSVNRDGMWIYDARGGKRIDNPELDDDDPASLLSPEDVVVAGDEIAVLDVILHTIQVFDRDGGFIRVVDLDKAWGREPYYPSDLSPHPDGGWVIIDFDYCAGNHIVHVDAQGRIRSDVVLKDRNGRIIPWINDMNVAPDGRVWVSDNFQLMRVGQKGRVDLVMGGVADPDILDEISTFAAGPGDRMYAVAERTGYIHVFDPAGHKLHVCRPDWTSSSKFESGRFAVDENGRVAIQSDERCQMGGSCAAFCFGPDGKRLGRDRPSARWCGYPWAFQPGTDRRWVIRNASLVLTDAHGQPLTRVFRRPGGDWLEMIEAFSVAPDGSIAIVAAHGDYGRTDYDICIYSRDSSPNRTIHVDWDTRVSPSIAWNGSRAVLTLGDAILVYDEQGDALGQWRHPLKGHAKTRWEPFILSNGREVLLYDAASAQMEVYELP